MFCPYCGEAIETPGRYCPFCGEELSHLDIIGNPDPMMSNTKTVFDRKNADGAVEVDKAGKIIKVYKSKKLTV